MRGVADAVGASLSSVSKVSKVSKVPSAASLSSVVRGRWPLRVGAGRAEWRHAVVVGAGIAGLSAARVLADRFERVTLVEQDTVDADTEYRGGVPQARHTHALLARGAAILEELFPGLRAELAGRGAPVFDLGESGRLLLPTGWAPRGAIGVPIQSATRAALEAGIRRRVMANPAVTVLGGVRVDGLCWDGDRVTGVRGGGRTIEADLVVDASGRTSTLSTAALAEAGHPLPAERVVRGDLSYSSRLYRVPADFQADWTATACLTYAPGTRRGAVVFPVEGGRWLITLIGAGGEVTPADEAGFLAYARSLPNPHIADSVAAAEPVAPLYRVVKLNNRWTLFHRAPRWPERLLCVGDVVCALNPVYGQGMTVAAMQALALRGLLADHARRGDLTGLARRFQRQAARDLRLPWLMATSSDLAWNLDEAAAHTRVAHWYFDRVLDLIPRDRDLFRRFYLTAHMAASPAALLHPRVVAAIAANSVRRLGSAA
ncbi:FAD-dependent oxidoreductase [Actinokineospora iranica]|nr:FAD-dependent monooxygenase [Actinokineospora iranica]